MSIGSKRVRQARACFLRRPVAIRVLYRKNGYLTGASGHSFLLSAMFQFAGLLLRIKLGRESHPRDDLLHQRELPEH